MQLTVRTRVIGNLMECDICHNLYETVYDVVDDNMVLIVHCLRCLEKSGILLDGE